MILGREHPPRGPGNDHRKSIGGYRIQANYLWTDNLSHVKFVQVESRSR